MSTNQSALEGLRDETRRILATILRPGDRVALIDFPNHRNHGDHLIYLGELTYLNDLGVEVAYVADPSRYSVEDLRSLVPKGPVLLHGGGSFGDRWKETQQFRERVIAELPDRQVIQLPQSIEFSEGPLLERAQAVYNNHPNLIHLIRDRRSERITRELFPENTVLYCPDMALGYRPTVSGEQKVDVVHLKRRDSEAIPGHGIDLGSKTSVIEEDWHFTQIDEIAWKAFHAPGALVRRVPALRERLYPLQRMMYDRMANLNVRSAESILCRGRVVLTDRLHATVLAALLGIPVVCMDNANGKIASIASDYLSTIPGVYFAQDPETARDKLLHLLSSR